MDTIVIDLDGRKQSVRRGSSLKDILKDRTDVIAAVLNHHLVSLDTTVFHGVSVSSVTRQEPRGRLPRLWRPSWNIFGARAATEHDSARGDRQGRI